ncbi:MAG: heparan-alpha-glucosaminide N-acetyltransferase domain-containing protein [Flavobacteriales bacterium]
MTSATTSPRFSSIDLLRGLVMVVMALDHVRDYFHADAFLNSPTDLATTSVPLFFTRWITHYCAPVFVFLAGTSAWIIHQRKSTRELTTFLVKRGIWLILVEITLVKIAWVFNPTLPRFGLQVIWAIGVGMLALAALIQLPFRAILITGLIIVFGHNALDGIHFDGAWWWKMLHERGKVEVNGISVVFAYPLIPWIGTMALGYCFGAFYGKGYTPEVRKRLLTRLGLAMVMLFVALRLVNAYGDMLTWSVQASPAFTVLSFLNVQKYPPSLLYLLMTLGPAILFLAWSENIRGWLASVFIVFGRVPFFYYILHLYLIHTVALVAAELTGFGWQSMILTTFVNGATELKGYGFSLTVVYLVWIGVVVALYPLCAWFNRIKSTNRQLWWLSYL